MSGTHWVYILDNAEGRFYIGHTDDLNARLARHNSPDLTGGRYTAKTGPWQLVWSEPHSDRSSAVLREREIKRMKSARWIREYLWKRDSS